MVLINSVFWSLLDIFGTLDYITYVRVGTYFPNIKSLIMDNQELPIDPPEVSEGGFTPLSLDALRASVVFGTTEEGKMAGEAPYKYAAGSWDVVKLRARYGRDAITSHKPGKIFTVGDQKYLVGQDGAWRKIKKD